VIARAIPEGAARKHLAITIIGKAAILRTITSYSTRRRSLKGTIGNPVEGVERAVIKIS
jgi:hypothetical protein